MMNKQKILIVDDRRENLFVLTKSLKQIDAEIVSAGSGEEALRAALDNRFALAILDVQMPGMNGYELAELLRSDLKTRNMPIIFMSAVYSDDTHVFKGYEAGAVDFLVKPYNPEHLKCKVKVFLELSRINNELAEKLDMLATSEERFRSLVRTIPDIVYRINDEGYFTYINEAIENLGYSPTELIGSHFSRIIHPDDLNEVSRKIVLKDKDKLKDSKKIIKLFDERRSGDRKTTELEIRLLVNNKTEAPQSKSFVMRNGYTVAEVNSSGITTDNSSRKKILIGTVGVIRDISVRKKTEEQLAVYQSKLEKMVEERTSELKKEVEEKKNLLEEKHQIEAKMIQQQKLESIGILAGGVAHEINNPINGIMNYAQLIKEAESCSEEVIEFSDAITRETERIAVIVRNLLQFARADQQSKLEKTNVYEMIEYVMSLIKTYSKRSQAELRVEIAENLPDISCRRGEIEQVLMNLLTNACDALNEKYPGYDENKMIKLKVEKAIDEKDEILRIVVKDSGPGIKEKNRDSIFEPFFTTKDRTKGTGLGLSISHGIIDAHHGKLYFKTKEDEYTEFYIELPVENIGENKK